MYQVLTLSIHTQISIHTQFPICLFFYLCIYLQGHRNSSLCMVQAGLKFATLLSQALHCLDYKLVPFCLSGKHGSCCCFLQVLLMQTFCSFLSQRSGMSKKINGQGFGDKAYIHICICWQFHCKVVAHPFFHLNYSTSMIRKEKTQSAQFCKFWVIIVLQRQPLLS